MLERYLIALNLETLRSGSRPDLAALLAERFPDAGVRVIGRGYAGRSVTVEIPSRLLSAIRENFPFVTVEPAREMDLLEGRARSGSGY